MPNITVDPAFWFFGGDDPINWARNHIGVPLDVRRTAAFANWLGAQRKKQVFEKSIRPTQCDTSSSDVKTWRGAWHTGPLTEQLGVEFVAVPADTPSNGTPTRAYWAWDTGLTGADPTTSRVEVFLGAVKAGTIVPTDYIRLGPFFADVAPDTDYRAVLHVENGMRVISSTIFEVTRTTLPIGGTGVVDQRRFGETLSILDAPNAALFAAADKYWKRGFAHIFSWSVPGSSPYTRGTASKANILDQTITTRSSTSPGFSCHPLNRHSLDSDNVGAAFYTYAGVTGGTGKVHFEWSTGAVSINVTGAASWLSTTGNFDGTEDDEKVDVFLEGPGGGDTLSVSCGGAFFHT